MKFPSKTLALILVGSAMFTSAHAAPTLNGSGYGAASATVAYDPAAPDSNFASPTNASKYVGYQIYLKTDGAYYYGLLKANPASGGSAVAAFANIYLDLDPANGNGSDLGFELSGNHADAFIPGVSGNVLTPDVATAVSSDGNTLEFAIPYTDLMQPIAGLSYYPGQAFPSSGDSVVLRLSQSFGYSVAGGSSYGVDRLGSVTLTPPQSVPEPLSITLFGTGLVGLGFLRRIRRI